MTQHILRSTLLLIFVSNTALSFGFKERLYVGMGIGQAALSNGIAVNEKTLGVSGEVKYRFSKYLEVAATVQGHTESGSPLITTGASLEIHPLNLSSLEFALGAGPALYTYSGLSAMRMGGNFGAVIDIVFNDAHLGVGSRYHAVMDPAAGGAFWNVFVRLGYSFNIG